MVEILHEDYIRTASAKGVRGSRVLFKHALRSAIVPVVTIFGLDFAFLLGGVIFHRADLQHRRDRLLGPPRPLDADRHQRRLRGGAVSAITVVVANLLVDACYGFLDPRVTVA